MRFLALLLVLFSSLNASSPSDAPLPKTIVLYYLPYCPYSIRVLNYLREIDDHSVTLKNVKDNTEAKEELRNSGGKMQVPCLVVDGQAIYNDGEIIEWLSAHRQPSQETGRP